MGMRALPCLLLLAACSGSSGAASAPSPTPIPTPLDQQAQAGTRLTPHYYTVGGARLLAGFQDTLLGVGCSPFLAADGRLRCVPWSDYEAFANADCTGPAAVGVAGLAPPALATVVESLTCSYRLRVREVGSSLAGAWHWDLARRNCVPLESPWQAWALGAEVDPSRLVAFQTTADPAQDGLAVEWLTGDDGSRQFAGMRDTTGDFACAPDLASDAVTRCLPNSFLVVVESPGIGYFGDEACTKPALSASTCSLGDRYVRVSAPGPGATSIRIHGLGAVASGHVLSGTTCSPAAATVGFETHLIGPEIPPASFVAGQARTLTGDRLSVDVVELSGGRLVRPSLAWNLPALQDRQLGLDCVPQVAADGVVRCLPVAYSPNPFTHPQRYYDDKCTIPVLVGSQWMASSYAARWDFGYAEPRVHIYRLGDPAPRQPGNFVYGGPSCAPFALPGTSFVYALTDELSPETFAGGTYQ